jgi:hypothetical protein
MHPHERGDTVADFQARSGSRLQAIRAKCIDCSGGSLAEVRDCWAKDCDLYPYRMGKSGRTMSDEQKAAAAARLRSSHENALERGRFEPVQIEGVSEAA